MRNILIALLGILVLGSCHKEQSLDRPQPMDCANEQIVFDDALFEVESTSDFKVVSAQIVEDCLVILYTSNSCEDSDSWDDVVVSKENWDNGYIILGLNVDTQNHCDEIYAKELYVDLTPLRIPGETVSHIQLRDYISGMFYYYGD